MKLTTYNQLSSVERLEFITELLHCIQNNNTLFESAAEIVELGKEWKMFTNVKIGLEVKTFENQES